MSKFSKPKATQGEIDRVIQRADAIDNHQKVTAHTEPEDVRFTMTLTGAMAERVDRARKAAGGMSRLAWVRLAIAEKISRDGV